MTKKNDKNVLIKGYINDEEKGKWDNVAIIIIIIIG